MRSVLVIVIASAMLAGCSSPGAEQPPTASPSASTEPVAPSPTATSSSIAAPDSVVVLADSLTISGASEETKFDYFDAGTELEVVAALTAAFGASPEIVEVPATGNHDLAGTEYRWRGFVLDDVDVDADYPTFPAFFVRVDAASVGVTTISTAGDLAVGDPADDATLDKHVIPEAVAKENGLNSEDYHWVAGTIDDGSGRLTGFSAPRPSFGA